MIINLRGTVNNDNTIKFDLTPVYFSQKSYVSVNELCIIFSKKIDNLCGSLSTTLVDKSAINPEQEIVFFNQREKSRILYFSPRHPAEYIIQGYSLHLSEFSLRLNYADNLRETLKPDIEEIYLQLNVKCKASVLH